MTTATPPVSHAGPPDTAPFPRTMKVTGVLLLTLSAVTPASSVFVIIPGIIAQAGTGAFVSLTAAALVALAMALVYAELASAFPHAGGEYAMMGRTLGPFVGYVFMGMNVIGSTLAPAVLALGAADYVTSIWPNAPRVPLAMGIVGVSMLLGVLNIRVNAWVTGVFLLVEVIALVVLGVLGFTHIHRWPAEFLAHPVALHLGQLAPTPIAMMGLATAVAVFSYNGFGAAVYFSEEMHEAPKLVARTILLALILTVAFEFVPVTAVLMGSSDLRTLLASPTPFSVFLRETGGPWVDTLVSLGIALAIVNAVIATVLMNARFLFSSGRDGIWHGVFNTALVNMHDRFQSPWIATLVAGASAMATCLIPFHILLVMNGAGVVVMYLLLCLGAIAGRITGATAHAAYRMPLFPLAPAFGLLALGYVVYANWLDADVGRPSLIFNLVLIVAATSYFLFLRRRRGGSPEMSEPRTAVEVP
jgi:amino acid transporter